MVRLLLIKSLRWSGILVELGLLILQGYLTDVWKLSFTHAAGILNIWSGITKILPVFFLFLVDAFLGHLTMLVLSSVAYTLGIVFIFISVPSVLANSTGTCKEYEPSCIGHTQKSLFYTGLALVAVGISGHRVSLDAFLEEQKSTVFEGLEEQNSTDSEGLPIWKLILKYMILGVCIPIIGTVVLPLLKLWWIEFGIPAICSVVATLLFLSGWCVYKNNEPKGSLLTNVCRVFVACVSNCNISGPLPDYRENYDQEPQSFPRTRTSFPRCLDKATIDTSPENQVKNKWRHCSKAEVEEAKIVVRMVPMWMTSIICGVVTSIGNTYFLEQANHMSRKVGKIKVPLPLMLLFFTWIKILARDVVNSQFDELLFLQKDGPTNAISMALVNSVVCCITAAGVEIRRLNVIKRHGLLDKPDKDIPMSIFWLVFQFYFLGAVESCFEKGFNALYSQQAPKSMKNYLGFLTEGVTGFGFIFSVLSVYVVGKISEREGKPNWFQFTLNRSRLDRYYWMLAALSSFNLVMFGLVCCFYDFKKLEAEAEEEELEAV